MNEKSIENQTESRPERAQASERVSPVRQSSKTPIILCYQTEIKNLFMFVSHRKDGESNVSYGLISDDKKTMVEVIPKYGPITVLKSKSDIIEDYLEHNTDRGNWLQGEFDNGGYNDNIVYAEHEILAMKLKTFLNLA